MLGLVWTLAAYTPQIDPSSSALPGGTVAKQIVNGLGFYGLLFCIAGLVLSAGLWAIGAFSNNYSQSINGKKGLLVSAGAALVIGGAGPLIEFFQDLGTKV